jgi:hypothetical protein
MALCSIAKKASLAKAETRRWLKALLFSWRRRRGGIIGENIGAVWQHGGSLSGWRNGGERESRRK